MPYTGGEGCATGCGRCFGGIPVSVHWTFWFISIFQILISILYYQSPIYILCIATAYIPILFVTILIHEYGHIWRTRACGGSCSHILLWPLGGFSNCHIPGGTCLQEFSVALCGPLMHIPQIVVWLVIVAIVAPDGVSYVNREFDINEFENGGVKLFFAKLGQQAFVLNMMIFIMNMFIPAYPMDCVKALAAILVHFGLPLLTTAYTVAIIGLVLGFVCFIFALNAMFNKTGNGFTFLMVSLFVLYTSGSLLYMAKMGTYRSHPIFEPECFDNPQGVNRPASNTPVIQQQPTTSRGRSRSGSRPKKEKKKVSGDVEMGNASPARQQKKPKADKKKKASGGK
jgi:hypothetical protein